MTLTRALNVVVAKLTDAGVDIDAVVQDAWIPDEGKGKKSQVAPPSVYDPTDLRQQEAATKYLESLT